MTATTASKPTPAVRFLGVAKRYASFQALDHVSFDVAQGEFLTLLGPSGSGKSTLLSMVAGAVEPDVGQVLFSTRDVTRLAPAKRNVGMVFQRYTLFPNKTVAENIAFPLNVRKLPRDEVTRKVTEALRLVNLSAQADRYPSEISGGQAQRVAVARALVFDPDVMLMDEPLGALDKALRDSLQDEIRRIQQETGVPTIYVTHDQEEAMNLSDRIIMLNHGRIAAEGRPRDLYERPANLWSAKFLGDANVIAVATWSAQGPGLAAATSPALGQFLSRRPESLTGPALAILRPEDLRVSQAGVAGVTSGLTGTLISATYLGGRQKLRIRLSDGTVLLATPPGRLDPGPVGGTVTVAWAEDAPWLVPAEDQ